MPDIMNLFISYGIYFLSILFQLLYWSILLWVLMSWGLVLGMMRPDNKLWQTLSQMIDPILKPFRWARIGMIDLSPIVAILALSFLTNLMTQVMYNVMG